LSGITDFVHSNFAVLIEVVVLVWIVAMIILFYLYWKKGRFEGLGKDVKAIEQKVIAATGKIYCPKCATQMDASKPCTNCGYDLKTPLTTGPQAPTITVATAATTEVEFGHGFKIRGHGGLIDDLPQTLLPPSLASLKNSSSGNGTKDQAVPQTTMKDPPATTTPATPKKDEPTLDQLVDQRIATLPNMDTGQLINLKTELDTSVETYQKAVTELNTELGPYRRLQMATTRNLITNLVKEGTIDLNANPELKSLINAPPEGSQIIDKSKSLPADQPAVTTPQPALAPAPTATTPEPPKSEPAPDLSITTKELQEQAADQTTAKAPLEESEAEGISPSSPAEESTPSGEPTVLRKTEPITNVKFTNLDKKPKGGRSRKRKRQEQAPPEEPKDETENRETALSSGSNQQLVVQTYEQLDEQSQEPSEAPPEAAPEEPASEEIGTHGFEINGGEFFQNQNSTAEEEAAS